MLRKRVGQEASFYIPGANVPYVQHRRRLPWRVRQRTSGHKPMVHAQIDLLVGREQQRLSPRVAGSAGRVIGGPHGGPVDNPNPTIQGTTGTHRREVLARSTAPPSRGEQERTIHSVLADLEGVHIGHEEALSVEADHGRSDDHAVVFLKLQGIHDLEDV